MLEFFDRFSKKVFVYYISRKFVRLEPSSFVQTDRRTDGRTDTTCEASSRLSQIFEYVWREPQWIDMQEKVVMICRPTVRLQRMVGVTKCWSDVAGREKLFSWTERSSMQLLCRCMNRELADNGRWVSVISVVTRIMVVISRSLGSIPSKVKRIPVLQTM